MNTISKIIYDCYKGEIPAQYSGVAKKEREDAIRKEIFEVLGIQEGYSKKEFRRAFKENKNKVYAIIEDVVSQALVDGEVAKNTFFNQFVEVKNLALGDKNLFTVEGKNEVIVSEFSGSHFSLRRQRVESNGNFSVEMRDFGARIYTYVEQVMSGRIDFAKLTTLLIEAIDKKLAQLAQATFAAALKNIPTDVKHTGTYNEEAILEKLVKLGAINGGKPVLLGTNVGLRQLQGVVDVKWSDDMKDARNSNFVLPVWNGYTCVEIEQGVKAGSFELTMDNKKVYAICGETKPVKMTLEGDVEVSEVTEGTGATANADRSLDTAMTFKAGCAVAYNKLIGLIELQ